MSQESQTNKIENQNEKIVNRVGVTQLFHAVEGVTGWKPISLSYFAKDNTLDFKQTVMPGSDI